MATQTGLHVRLQVSVHTCHQLTRRPHAFASQSVKLRYAAIGEPEHQDFCSLVSSYAGVALHAVHQVLHARVVQAPGLAAAHCGVWQAGTLPLRWQSLQRRRSRCSQRGRHAAPVRAGRLSGCLCAAGAACLPQRRHGVQAADRASAAGDLARAAARPPVAALQEGLCARHRAGRRNLREAAGPVTPESQRGRLRARRACREARPVEACRQRRAARAGSGARSPSRRSAARCRRPPTTRASAACCSKSRRWRRAPRCRCALSASCPRSQRVSDSCAPLALSDVVCGPGRRSAGRACRSCASTLPSSGRAASSPWRS